MDRMVLYAGGVALLLLLAGVPWLLGTSVRNEVAENVEPTVPPPTPEAVGTFHRGVVLGVFPHGNERPRYAEDLREIRAIGANTVSLNFNWFMDTVHDSSVYRGRADANNQTPHDDILKQAINDAHDAGLRVMMFPSVYLLNLGPGQWRGTIQPPDWSAWFASYRSLVVSLARLSEEFGVEYLCIGIELISSERFTDEWMRIIDEVRAVYSGEVLYSANWYARRRNPWYRELDQIAMNAYYSLSRSNRPSKVELVESWRRIRHEIAAWREWVGRPLIISEIGYRSAEGTLAAPWNYFMRGDVDLEVQRLAYDAFFEAWHEDDLFEGVYFYQWYGPGGMRDTTYTPRGKPAAVTLKHWFERIARREAEAAMEPEVAELPGSGATNGNAAEPKEARLPRGLRPLQMRSEPEPQVRMSGEPQRWRGAGESWRPVPDGPRMRIDEIDPAFGSITVRDLETGNLYQLFAPPAD